MSCLYIVKPGGVASGTDENIYIEATPVSKFLWCSEWLLLGVVIGK